MCFNVSIRTLILINITQLVLSPLATLADDKYLFCPCINKTLTMVRFNAVQYVVLFTGVNLIQVQLQNNRNKNCLNRFKILL